jgi:large subunit ribosomal protein L9
MAIPVILTKTVDHLGKAGEMVNVAPGYARNFLLPHGLAVTATSRNRARLDHERGVIERKVAKERADAEGLAERINMMTLQFERRVGDQDKLFGSVTSRNIADQLKVAGLEISTKVIQLDEPIKSIGKYEVPVKLSADVTATLKFWVVGKDEE